MTDGPPLRNEEGSRIPEGLEVFREIKEIAVEPNAQEIEGRGALANHGQELCGNTGSGGGRVRSSTSWIMVAMSLTASYTAGSHS